MPQPKKKKGQTRPDSAISIEKYNEMYEAYHKNQAIDYVAKACGVHWNTAKKYIYRGDKSRSLKPIKARFENTMLAAQKREDYNITKARSETLLLVRAVEAKIAQRIKEVISQEFEADKIPGHLKMLLETKAKAMGEPDRVIHVNDARQQMKEILEKPELVDEVDALENALLNNIPDA